MEDRKDGNDAGEGEARNAEPSQEEAKESPVVSKLLVTEACEVTEDLLRGHWALGMPDESDGLVRLLCGAKVNEMTWPPPPALTLAHSGVGVRGWGSHTRSGKWSWAAPTEGDDKVHERGSLRIVLEDDAGEEEYRFVRLEEQRRADGDREAIMCLEPVHMMKKAPPRQDDDILAELDKLDALDLEEDDEGGLHDIDD